MAQEIERAGDVHPVEGSDTLPQTRTRFSASIPHALECGPARPGAK